MLDEIWPYRLPLLFCSEFVPDGQAPGEEKILGWVQSRGWKSLGWNEMRWAEETGLVQRLRFLVPARSVGWIGL